MASLADTLSRLRMTHRWAGISDPEEIIRKAILRHFIKTGKAPDAKDISASTGLTVADINGCLPQLRHRDLIVLDDQGTVVGAYPFSNRKTEHSVTINGVTINAMCAIDALGAGAMTENDSLIRSRCRQCGQGIEITTTENGRRIQSATPAHAVVWSGVEDIDACAADTQCTVMAMFCSDDHLSTWRRQTKPAAKGHRLTLAEGLEAGRAIFQPFLA